MIQVYELVNCFNLTGSQKIIFKDSWNDELAKIDVETQSWDEVLNIDVTLSDNFHQRKLGHCKVKSSEIKKSGLIITIATSLNYY